MTIARIALGLWFAFAGAFGVSAADHSEVHPLQFELTGAAMDGPNLAHAMMRTFMTESEWQEHVAKCRRRYETWEADNHGDMGQFLNDRLIIVALSAAGGEVEKIQNGVAYLALYREFRQVPPSRVMKFLREHKGSVSELLNGFTWVRVSEYVKQKKWREDIARRKELASQKSAEMAAKEGETKPVEVASARPQTVEATPASQPQTERLPQALLKLMSLDWDAFSPPMTADTP